MKRLFLVLFLFFGTLGLAQAQSYQLDAQNSKVGWVGKKVTGQHNGSIQVKSGQVEIQGQKVTGGQFVIDMPSIRVLDLQDPGANAKLTNHLKSDDFFSVQTYPESTFKISSVQDKGNNQVEVAGELTIKGITHPISFPATVSFEGGKVTAKGTAKIDRTKWNVRYGSGKFFQGLGDKLIYDDFELSLDLVAKPVS